MNTNGINSIPLNQDELKVIVGLLLQLKFSYQESKIVNPLIEKLDSYVEKPKEEEVKKGTDASTTS